MSLNNLTKYNYNALIIKYCSQLNLLTLAELWLNLMVPADKICEQCEK